MSAVEELADIVAVKFSVRRYEIAVTEHEVRFGDGTVFKSRDLARRLCECTRCAVFAATLGHGVDRALRSLQYKGLTGALEFDRAANICIEQVCDDICAALGETLQAEGLCLTARYSPGYGDFKLEHQPDVLRLADAQKRTGLTLSAQNLLLPQKSVTAIVGFCQRDDAENRQTDSCKDCPSCEKCRKGESNPV